jgi:hypothetical protein
MVFLTFSFVQRVAVRIQRSVYGAQEEVSLTCARSARAIIVFGKAVTHGYGSYGHYADETPLSAIHPISHICR